VAYWKWHTVVKQGKSVTVHDVETAEKGMCGKESSAGTEVP
jgi:hypothetical protein